VLRANLLFPNVPTSSSDSQTMTYQVVPTGPETCEIDIRVRAEPGASIPDDGVVQLLKVLRDEDGGAVEQIQRVLRSPRFSGRAPREDARGADRRLPARRAGPPDVTPERLAGAWRRVSLAVGDGPASEPASVVWLQAGDRYADLRVTTDPDGTPASFAGTTSWHDPFLHWAHELDLDPSGGSDVGHLRQDGDDLVETGTAAGPTARWATPRCGGACPARTAAPRHDEGGRPRDAGAHRRPRAHCRRRPPGRRRVPRLLPDGDGARLDGGTRPRSGCRAPPRTTPRRATTARRPAFLPAPDHRWHVVAVTTATRS
jgi:hypothetical protein